MLFESLIAAAIFLFLIFMSFRNLWTMQQLLRVIRHQSMFQFERLPSYNYILWHFWIWDIEKFKRKHPELN